MYGHGKPYLHLIILVEHILRASLAGENRAESKFPWPGAQNLPASSSGAVKQAQALAVGSFKKTPRFESANQLPGRSTWVATTGIRLRSQGKPPASSHPDIYFVTEDRGSSLNVCPLWALRCGYENVLGIAGLEEGSGTTLKIRVLVQASEQ